MNDVDDLGSTASCLFQDASVGHAVVVLKSLVQPDQSSESVSESIKLVSKLVRQLPEITNGSARACVYWLTGQYAESPSDNQQTAGTSSFEGLQPWAPDALRLGAKEFIREVRPRQPELHAAVLTIR